MFEAFTLLMPSENCGRKEVSIASNRPLIPAQKNRRVLHRIDPAVRRLTIRLGAPVAKGGRVGFPAECDRARRARFERSHAGEERLARERVPPIDADTVSDPLTKADPEGSVGTRLYT